MTTDSEHKKYDPLEWVKNNYDLDLTGWLVIVSVKDNADIISSVVFEDMSRSGYKSFFVGLNDNRLVSVFFNRPKVA